MSIYDDARALGKAMLESDECKKVTEAREVFENDTEAKALVEEYTELKNQWQEIMSNPESDKAILTELGEKIVATETKIKETEATFNLLKAESEFGAYVNSVFGLVSATLQGEEAQDPMAGGCSPSACASCSGC